jgi:hypothetical protein
MDSFTDSPDEEAPRMSNGNGKPLSTTENNIRKQESLLLNIWTQQVFFLVAGCSAFLMIVALVSASGAPSDPRCTLPWC